MTPSPAGIRNYLVVTSSYWSFTLSDGALRMLVLMHFFDWDIRHLHWRFCFTVRSCRSSSQPYRRLAGDAFWYYSHADRGLDYANHRVFTTLGSVARLDSSHVSSMGRIGSGYMRNSERLN